MRDCPRTCCCFFLSVDLEHTMTTCHRMEYPSRRTFLSLSARRVFFFYDGNEHRCRSHTRSYLPNATVHCCTETCAENKQRTNGYVRSIAFIKSDARQIVLKLHLEKNPCILFSGEEHACLERTRESHGR